MARSRAQTASLIAGSRKSSFRSIGFAPLSTLPFGQPPGQCPRIGYETFNLLQGLFRKGFPVVVGGKVPVVPIREPAAHLIGREQAVFRGMAQHVLEVKPVHLAEAKNCLRYFPMSLPPVSRTSSKPLMVAFR